VNKNTQDMCLWNHSCCEIESMCTFWTSSV